MTRRSKSQTRMTPGKSKSRAGIELRPRILCPCCGRTTRDRRENSSTGVATTGIGTARQSRAKAQRGGEKRSEERRVGKECRSRWSAGGEKKKEGRSGE